MAVGAVAPMVVAAVADAVNFAFKIVTDKYNYIRYENFEMDGARPFGCQFTASSTRYI